MQTALTVLCAAVVWPVWGWHGSLSAMMGGAVTLAATAAFGLAYLWRSPRDQGNAGRALITMLFAEAIKWMTAISGLLWLFQTRPLDVMAGPMVVGFIVALTGSWFALLTKT